MALSSENILSELENQTNWNKKNNKEKQCLELCCFLILFKLSFIEVILFHNLMYWSFII